MIYSKRQGESLSDYEERLYRNQSFYNITWEKINELLGLEQHPDSTRKASYGFVKRANMEKEHKFDKSVMIINDLHLPFEREDVLEIINKHKEEITTLVIGGDLMDCESISKFPKIERLKLEDELIYTYNWLKKVRKILNKEQKIILIRGNHEWRLYRTICNLHKKNLQTFINPEVLNMIIEGFTIYDRDGKRRKYGAIEGITYIPHWFVNLDNKLIVAHPLDFSRVKGKLLEANCQHFVNRGEQFQVIAIGHSHKISSGIIDRFQGKFAYENGCLCKPMNYADVGKLGYTPQAYGYSIVKYNNDEDIDFNNIELYYLKETIKKARFTI